MDLNFADLKKEAAATADDIFGHAQSAVKQTGHDLLGSLGQDDNAHTEQQFANAQKEMNFDNVDPQAFVQRMSAGAKEAQEQLDAKFAQSKDDFVNFMEEKKDSSAKLLASATNDFMNAERGFMAGAGDVVSDYEKKASQAVDDLFGSHMGSGDDNKFAASAPLVPAPAVAAPVTSAAPAANPPLPAEAPLAPFTAMPTSSTMDSDTDSPSVSYNASPAKKIPATDALKEQDNDKFISSEDLLGDFSHERTATPDSLSSIKLTSNAAPMAPIRTTDLDLEDDDDDFIQAEIPKPAAPVVKPVTPPPTPVAAASPSTPVVVAAPPSPPVVVAEKPMAKPAPAIPEPVKTQPEKPKVSAPAPTPAAAVNKPKSPPASNQPSIVSVEDIFYKYGLGKCLKNFLNAF